jgi:hypothetical protein
VWPARICSLILSEDPAIFLLKEMSLLQVYLLYVLIVPKKNLYTFISLCYEQIVGCNKCCSCVVHVLSVFESFFLFSFKRIAYTSLRAVKDILNSWKTKQTSVD